MPDADLRNQLSALHPPAPDETARGRALHRATLALASAPAPASAPARGTRPSFAFGFSALAALAVALTLGVTFFTRSGVSPITQLPSPSTDAVVLAEVEKLFPGQLNALIDRDGVLQLDLRPASDSAAPDSADQALLVELVRDGRRLRVISYSGRSVRVQLDGVELHFDALLTGAGEIVLAGADFIWTSATPRRLAGWRVEARPLVATL
ncbi:MAG: hypothetical protein RIQ79_1470 [Verrucomicrobiota bacterium]